MLKYVRELAGRSWQQDHVRLNCPARCTGFGRHAAAPGIASFSTSTGCRILIIVCSHYFRGSHGRAHVQHGGVREQSEIELHRGKPSSRRPLHAAHRHKRQACRQQRPLDTQDGALQLRKIRFLRCLHHLERGASARGVAQRAQAPKRPRQNPHVNLSELQRPRSPEKAPRIPQYRVPRLSGRLAREGILVRSQRDLDDHHRQFEPDGQCAHLQPRVECLVPLIRKRRDLQRSLCRFRDALG